MTMAYLLIGLSMLALGGTAVLGLYWAAKSGQFTDMRNGAKVIFDEEEPEGVPTDVVFKRWGQKAKPRQSRKIS